MMPQTLASGRASVRDEGNEDQDNCRERRCRTEMHRDRSAACNGYVRGLVDLCTYG